MPSPATRRFNNHGNVHPVCACVYCLGLDIQKERVTRQPALVILGSWSLFSLAMIWETMILNSREFTLARVLEDYHKNPLCHHSKLNAVFKSSQRFLQNKNEPGSQSSRSYSIHSFSKCYRSLISSGWQFDARFVFRLNPLKFMWHRVMDLSVLCFYVFLHYSATWLNVWISLIFCSVSSAELFKQS